jgi:Fe-S cluster biogenesis protein NfuA
MAERDESSSDAPQKKRRLQGACDACRISKSVSIRCFSISDMFDMNIPAQQNVCYSVITSK